MQAPGRARHVSCFQAVCFLTGVLAFGVSAACSDTPADDIQGFEGRVANLTEELRIDGHAELLTIVGSAALRRDGVLAILQPQQAHVRVYSDDGTHLGTFGSRGEGPGEFNYPRALGWVGDSLWVFDNNKITHISPDLQHIRTDGLNVAAYAPARVENGTWRHPELADGTPRALGIDGEIYALVADEEGQAIGQVNLLGEVQKRIIRVPPAEAALATVPSGAWVALPFGNLPKFTVAPSGERAIVAMASIDGPNAGTFLLTAADTRGDTLFSRRYRFLGESVTREAADSIADALVTAIGPQIPGAEAAIREEMRVPTYHPPLSGLLFGSDGSIWVGHTMQKNEQRWYVARYDGDPLGTLALPANSRLIAADTNRILVAEPDELDVESIVRYAAKWE